MQARLRQARNRFQQSQTEVELEVRPRRKRWRTLTQGPPQQKPLGGGPATMGQNLERKIKDKGGHGEGTQELIILGVLPWQPPESSNLQGWEDKLNRQSLRSSSTPLGLRNYRVALAPSPAWASSAKNWRPGGCSLAWSSQWPDPANPDVPCRMDAPFCLPAVSLSHPRDTENLRPAVLHIFLWTDCLGDWIPSSLGPLGGSSKRQLND